MRHNIGELLAFVAVVELRSFSGAAEKLHVTQPALSRRIAKIEEEVGEPLLLRGKRNIEPTRVGQRFYDIAKRLVIELQSAATELQNIRADDTGRVSLSINMTWSSIMLAHITKEFRARHPNYTLNVFEGSSAYAVKKVYDGLVDLGITQKPKQLFGATFEPFETDEFVVACHKEHPLAALDIIPLEELEKHVWMRLLRDDVFSSLDWIEFEGGARLPEALLSANHYFTILRLVDDNIGVTALPRMAIHQFKSENIVVRPFAEPLVQRTMGLLTKQRRDLSPAAQALSEIIRDAFAKRVRDGLSSIV